MVKVIVHKRQSGRRLSKKKRPHIVRRCGSLNPQIENSGMTRDGYAVKEYGRCLLFVRPGAKNRRDFLSDVRKLKVTAIELDKSFDGEHCFEVTCRYEHLEVMRSRGYYRRDECIMAISLPRSGSGQGTVTSSGAKRSIRESKMGKAERLAARHREGMASYGVSPCINSTTDELDRRREEMIDAFGKLLEAGIPASDAYRWVQENIRQRQGVTSVITEVRKKISVAEYPV